MTAHSTSLFSVVSSYKAVAYKAAGQSRSADEGSERGQKYV